MAEQLSFFKGKQGGRGKTKRISGALVIGKTLRAYVRARLVGYELRQLGRVAKRNGGNPPEQMRLFDEIR